MSYLYITEHGVKTSIRNGKLVCEDSSADIKEIPLEILEGIIMIGNSNINSINMKELLYRGIPVNFISGSGKFYGRLEPIYNINVKRQKMQLRIAEESSLFCNEFAGKVLNAKTLNQIVILRRYNRNRKDGEVEKIINKMKILRRKIDSKLDLNSIMGYEGIIGRHYFEGLSLLVRDEYKFSGRNRNPPKDAFNALISFGYALLFSEIYATIITRNLNPYIGIIHKDKVNHPALVSDLMEEWRPILVDSLVLKLLNSFSIKPDDFEKNYENGGIKLSNSGIKKFIESFNEKLNIKMAYIEGVNKGMTFRSAIAYQITTFIQALENNDVSLYNPVSLR